MKRSLKKRFIYKNKNQKYINIIFIFTFVFAILLTTGYSIYRQQIGNALSLSINKPIFTITLNNQSADSAGTAQIYEKYGTGYYLDSSVTNQMTTSANGITKPTKASHTFGGYYTQTNGNGTQYIDANGKLTASASNTNFTTNGSLYAKWEVSSHSVTVNVTNGTPTTQNKTVNHNASTTFTVNPNTNYGNAVVNCTNSQTATLSGTTLTTGNITQDTVCSVSYSLLPTYTVNVSIPTFNLGGVCCTNDPEGIATPSSSSVRSGNYLTVVTSSWYGNYYPTGVRCTNSVPATLSGKNLTIGPVTNNTTCTVSTDCSSWSPHDFDTTTITQGFSCSSSGCSNCQYYTYCCSNSTPTFNSSTGEWTINGTLYAGNQRGNKKCMFYSGGVVGNSCTKSAEYYDTYYSVTSSTCENSYTHRYYWTYTGHYSQCD